MLASAELARARSRRDARTAWWQTDGDSPAASSLVEVRFRQQRPDGIDEDVRLRETERLRDQIPRVTEPRGPGGRSGPGGRPSP